LLCSLGTGAAARSWQTRAHLGRVRLAAYGIVSD
jgi:hypothetical protein